MAIDEGALKIAARHAYERGRLGAAALRAAPVLVVVGAAWLADRDATPILLAGPLLWAAALVFLWRGGDLGRGVVPGVATGALPFAAMHLARASGHDCQGPLCWAACLPATFGAAAVAGIIVAHRARRAGAPFAAWTSAAIIAVLTGALGCACIGLGGVAGLIAGLVIGAVPIVARGPARG